MMTDDFERTLELRAISAEVERMKNGTYDAPITNTSAQDAAEHLLGAMRKGNGGEGFIEDMEAAGQAELVKAGGTRLPAEGTLTGAYGREPFDWASIGVKIGKVVKGDEIWVEAELPPGWKIDGSGHAMWSHLLDDKGRERAAIFYKAAFYDRSCNISPTCRYRSSTEAVRERDGDSPYFGIIMDAKEEIYRLGPFEGETEPRKGQGNYKMSGYSVADEAARAYLDEHYPDHRNPSKYWD